MQTVHVPIDLINDPFTTFDHTALKTISLKARGPVANAELYFDDLQLVR